MKKLNYKLAGVDVKKADKFVEKIKRFTSGIGSFGGAFCFDVKKYKHPVFISSTDGVGTKLKLAFLTGRHNTVGIDMVAMNVNDVICAGAKPLFFLDYIATGKIDTRILVDVVKGIAAGCKEAGCSLIGGETAEMPSFYKPGEYDLAGFCVGVVEKNKIINGSNTKTGDIILGIESSGLHSNGYSLARKVFSQKELKLYSKVLLEPTRIYVKPVLSLLATSDKRPATIKGIAHITGGAFYGKVPRIIPKDKAFNIYKDSWPIPRIFDIMQRKGSMSDREMYSCFNMGIGMVITVDKNYVKTAAKILAGFGFGPWVIGEVVKGQGEIRVL